MQQVDAALSSFWLERARTAPTAADLARHLADEADYGAALSAHLGAPRASDGTGDSWTDGAAAGTTSVAAGYEAVSPPAGCVIPSLEG